MWGKEGDAKVAPGRTGVCRDRRRQALQASGSTGAKGGVLVEGAQGAGTPQQ